MKLRLTFPLVKGFGLVHIYTDAGHGSYDALYINGEDLTGDGIKEAQVAQAIGQERYLWAMNEAINNGGRFNEALSLTLKEHRERSTKGQAG